MVNNRKLFFGQQGAVTNQEPQRVKMDLNKRLLPEQKTIKTLKYNPQGFKITIN